MMSKSPMAFKSQTTASPTTSALTAPPPKIPNGFPNEEDEEDAALAGDRFFATGDFALLFFDFAGDFFADPFFAGDGVFVFRDRVDTMVR